MSAVPGPASLGVVEALRNLLSGVYAVRVRPDTDLCVRSGDLKVARKALADYDRTVAERDRSIRGIS